MADKDEQPPVLRRGMSEHDWHPSDYKPPAQGQPFRWGIPRDLQPQSEEPPEVREERSRRWYAWARVGVGAVLVVAAMLFILQATLRGFHAEGVSMEPTLHNGDHIVIDKLAYPEIDFGLLDWAPLIDIGGHWATPGRGDVIVFRSPVADKELVKRVIGVPGENVWIIGNRVYVNGKQLDEPYAVGRTQCNGICNFIVPDGQYFVLGDNREDSLDSREGWYVPLGNIDGKKLFTY